MAEALESITVQQSGSLSRWVITPGTEWRRRMRRVCRHLELGVSEYLREIIIADVIRREEGFGLGASPPSSQPTCADRPARSKSTQERLYRFVSRLQADQEFDRAAVLKALPDAHPGTVSVYLGWLTRDGKLVRRRLGQGFLYRKAAEAQCA